MDGKISAANLRGLARIIRGKDLDRETREIRETNKNIKRHNYLSLSSCLSRVSRGNFLNQRYSRKSAAFSLLIFFSLITQYISPVFACGPAYVSPVFDSKHAPENPFENFAAGRIGVLKPTYRRIVLFAAYRYLNGGGFSADEQRGLIDVWNAEFNNKSFNGEDVAHAVKVWAEKRKEVAKDEENPPSIYTEREYGGYDFFPNCTKSAFETATQTLADRISSYGAEDKNVRAWLKTQDQVFMNCASGQQIPEPAELEAPNWLKKDREYQIAAANFYSLNYETARNIWTKIAEDSESIWAETADYLIARTLLREASLSKNPEQAREIYDKAEAHLYRLTRTGGKFYGASVKLLNLIKYRVHPEERVRELARTLANPGASDDLRQDLIDYSWLLDKFEKQVLEAEDKRIEELKKQEEERVENVNANTNSNSSISFSEPSENQNLSVSKASSVTYQFSEVESENYKKIQSGEALSFYLTVNGTESRNYTFLISKTDEEIYKDVETRIGRTLTDKEKETIQEARRQSYRNKTTVRNYEDYQGGYYGSTKNSRELLPDFFREDDLTDWLFTYQINDRASYEYSLSRWRENKSDLWLMTALTKAEKSSTDLKRLLEEAERFDRNKPAFPTVAYHTARIYIEQKKFAEARKLLDDILNSSLDMPISSRNLFTEQRMSLAETLDEFLKFAQRKPFAFDYDGTTGTVEEFIAEQKSWYNPKHYTDQTREEYEREVEERFKEEKLWQERLMFDEDAVEIINQHFPLTVLLEAEKSPALPDYLQKRLALAIWMRAILLNNDVVARKISPEVLKFMPEIETLFAQYQNAPTPVERRRAALYLILKNPILTPFLESGIGKNDNEAGQFDSDDWWCQPYDMEYDEETGSERRKRLPNRPLFLTKAQSDTAQAERAALKSIGEAPHYLGETVLEWQKLAPADKRIPEMLYITYVANGWTKYGCGNNKELQEKIVKVMKTRYPKSKWTAKMLEEETQNN